MKIITGIVILAIIVIGYSFYANNINANWLIYPSARHKSVQSYLRPIQYYGLDIAKKINWDYIKKKSETKKNTVEIENWNIEILETNKYVMIKKVLKSSSLVLIISTDESNQYAWEFYPTKYAKAEYLYIAP